ncbi:MAG TPA: preprotein translocase subunit SecA, partial [Chitinophagales bacterium]|nr:preprotein translocase subunit SecA [Chitinophagales bacterium]
MANFLEKFFGKLFGSRSERELKQLTPLVASINAAYQELKPLSNDQLRNKTQEFRSRIKEHLKEIDGEIAALNASAESVEDIREKDSIYKQVDELRKQRDKKIEEVLQEILPEAFAVVKEVSYRFTNNETLQSTATELDRNLAAFSPNIIIDGNNATYKNSWLAAGTEVKWDMVH